MIKEHSKTIMAKLLANENITVKHGSYPTAFFDVRERLLALPLWNNSEVYDLLLAHEVGHALYTNADEWDSVRKTHSDIPQSTFNVVEDIRIEKLVLRKYPGLLSAFKRGYQNMFDTDKMGINRAKVIKLNDYQFVDRLNIKAKLRDLVEVEFTKDEQKIIDRAHAMETWQDVVDVVVMIKEHLARILINPSGIVMGMDVSDLDMNENSEYFGELPESFKELVEDYTEHFNNKSAAESTSEGESRGISGASSTGIPASEEDIKKAMQSETDAAMEAIKYSYVEKEKDGTLTKVFDGVHPAHQKNILIPFEKLQAQRKEFANSNETKKFILEIKDVVSCMAKDFEMRKSAYQFKKATVSKSGTLDLGQLHNYKFSDDIFLRSTKLGEYKNHGIVMLVDYSGSMSGIMPDVIRQLLILVSFCKKVHIPFDVWGFTSSNKMQYEVTGNVHVKNLAVFNIISSFMTKKDYATAFSELVARTDKKKFFYTAYGYESMSDTPLNEALLSMIDVIKEFRRKTNVQKLSLINLTDGEAGPMSRHGFIKVVDTYEKYDYYGNFTEKILNRFKKSGLVDNTMNYFLSNYVPYSLQINDKKFGKKGYIVVDNKNGYDRVILLNSQRLNESEELQIGSLKKSDISKAFKKFNSGKQKNRVVATKFSEILA